MSSVYFIGDIHGHYNRLRTILHERAELIDENGNWQGGTATLCFIGDYTDRGPDGLRVIDLVMRLQAEAEAAGGRVTCLLGNHEVFLLAAYHFSDNVPGEGYRSERVSDWLAVGGVEGDLNGLTWAHVKWLSNLPAMAKINNRLCIHADSLFYLSYGRSVEQVNQTIREVLQSRDPIAWDTLIQRFIIRRAFQGEHGAQTARDFLDIFGGKQIIHGHTPIRYVTGQPAITVLEPLVYADGLCINIDPGMYMGGRGFVFKMKMEKPT